MRKETAILLLILISSNFLFYLSPILADNKISKTVNLKEKSVIVTVHYRESKEWAEHVLKLTADSLPILEEFAGFPYQHNFDIEIFEKSAEELKTICGTKEIGRSCNKGRDGIYMHKDVDDGTIIHENAHWWATRPPFRDKWMIEGLAEYLTVKTFFALGRKMDGENYKRYMTQYFLDYEKDFKLFGWSPTGREVEYGYDKAFCFFYVLSKELGSESLEKANLESYNQSKKKGDVDPEKYREILKEITSKNLDEFFSGWIFEGEYYYEGNIVDRNWFFSDSDKDGILNLDEKDYGTNLMNPDSDRDGVVDGYELILGTDPLKKDTDGDGLLDGDELKIVIDGKKDDWSSFQPTITDDTNDLKFASSEGRDITKVYYATDSKHIYIMIEFTTPPNLNNWCGVMFDFDNDNYAEFAFSIRNNSIIVDIWKNKEWVRETNSSQEIGNTFGIENQVVEFRIPKTMKLLRFPQEFNLWTYDLTPGNDERNDDTFLVRVSLNDNPVEGTNPLKKDSDSDGLLDSEDPHPLTKESEVKEEKVQEEETKEEEIVEEETKEIQEPEEKVEEETEKALWIWIIFVILLVSGVFFLLKKRKKGKKFLFCPNCGKPCGEEDLFCQNCGNRLR